MERKSAFFIDDVIWVFRDLTRERPSSMFDHPFMKALKEAHDKYGVKTQLNVFYRTSFFYGNDEFSLSDMTDAYKSEWEASSTWLRLGFHSKEEWPDYPYVNADYSLVDENFKLIKKEIVRFAGEKSFALSVVPHWAPISRDGICALSDNGIKVTYTTHGEKKEFNGEQASLPYGHSYRLLHNRKPETGVFKRNTHDTAILNSICAYNHIDDVAYNAIAKSTKTIKDAKTGMSFMDSAHAVLNLLNLSNIRAEFDKFIGQEYICTGNHEQYFYPDYFAYQSEYAEKILVMGEILNSAGYEFIFMEDLVK